MAHFLIPYHSWMPTAHTNQQILTVLIQICDHNALIYRGYEVVILKSMLEIKSN